MSPTDEERIKKRFGKKGYRTNPVLQDPQGADITFDKPLPDGRRKHVRITDGGRYWNVKSHCDAADPYRNPFGHLQKDIGVKHREETFKIKKTRSRQRKKSFAERLLRGY